jgi:hypothetical protein
VGAAPLPGRAGQVRRDRLDQPGVGVGGDQADPGQAAGDEVGEELVPRRHRFRLVATRRPEDLAVPVAVDPGGDQHDGVDHPAAFADLHRQRVRGHERERARLVQGAVAELLDVLVELGGHPGDLRLRRRCRLDLPFSARAPSLGLREQVGDRERLALGRNG